MSSPQPSPAAARETYRRALEKIETLHGNFAVLARLGTLLRDPNNGVDELAALIKTDGTLAATAIRLSNSIHYGIGGLRVATVQDALVKVGFKGVLNLVGSALSKQVFMRDLGAYGISANDYWTQSYFCGVFLEACSRRLGLAEDDAYLVGLLHGIGKVVINDLLAQAKVEVFWDASLPCEEWETLVLGFRNDEAGAYLLKKWKFTPAVYQRIADQHSGDARAADPLLRLLSYAQDLAHHNGLAINRAWNLIPDHPFPREQNWDDEELGHLVEQARRNCLSVSASLGHK